MGTESVKESDSTIGKQRQQNGTIEAAAEVEQPAPLYSAKEHDTKFDPEAYLNGFYRTAREDEAMQIVLFFLPGIAYRLPKEVGTLLDLGSGPTIYVPILMRHRAREIYVSDYAKANRDHLIAWLNGENSFSWKEICEWIASIEATVEGPTKMEMLARGRVRAVLEVNVHCDRVVRGISHRVGGDEQIEVPEQFDVVTTVFCLEYATETLDEYRKAVRGACSLVKPGGHLLQGGVLHANEYSFAGRRFRCHYLTVEHIMECLTENGMCTDEKTGNFKMICHDDIFLLVAKSEVNK